jgi:hypothetical protein
VSTYTADEQVKQEPRQSVIWQYCNDLTDTYLHGDEIVQNIDDVNESTRQCSVGLKEREDRSAVTYMSGFLNEK